MKYVTKNKGDEDKVSQALQKMMAEDVTLKVVNDSENRQALLYGIGDQHLEIAVSKLLDRYKCEVTLETPKVAFRETIRKQSDVDSKYKKQIRWTWTVRTCEDALCSVRRPGNTL